MLLKEIIQLFDVLDNSKVNGNDVADLFKDFDLAKVDCQTISGENGSTDVIKIVLPGENGKEKGGSAPTLGILGTLGGVGARPEMLGMVSDADGAIVALASALKLATMQKRGDICPGDVVISTQVCPCAPTRPHDPTPFMGSPVPLYKQVELEITPEMDAILSVDTTKGNRVANNNGFAISPTVKQGYIMRVSEDLLTIMEWVTGEYPVTFPITTQDITPYGNDVYHLNSILQPSVYADCPVVGVALTTKSAVPGCGTGANMPYGLESAARYCVEVAKVFGKGKVKFVDDDQFELMQKLYGSMDKLRKL